MSMWTEDSDCLTRRAALRRLVMRLIRGTTQSQERTANDRSQARVTYLTRSGRDAAGPAAMGMRTSRFLLLPSGDRVEVVIEVWLASMAPRNPEPAAPASVLRGSYRVSVFVPTVSNPPIRVPFGAERFLEFEAALAGWTTGWSQRPGLTVGMWLSPDSGWVRDASRVYDVIVSTIEEAQLLTAQVYPYVAEHFGQKEVLITVTPEYSTLTTKDGLRVAA